MLIRTTPTIPTRDITDERLYLDRRAFIRPRSAPRRVVWPGPCCPSTSTRPGGAALANVRKSPLSTTGEKLNPFEDITSYNNFYEFGTDKSDPKANSGKFKPAPWTVKIDGEVGKPGDYTFEDLLKRFPLEERIYRLRCVEGWSMVIPWVGSRLATC